MQKRSHNSQTVRPLAEVEGFDGPPLRRREAQDALPPVVYAVIVPGRLVKIGFTSQLNERRRALRATAVDALLGFRPGSLEDEQSIHERLADHVHHGREYYFPTPGVLRVVNELRVSIGLPPLDEFPAIAA